MFFVKSLNDLSRGAAYSALPIQKLNAHRISLPPLKKQEAIVSQLDSLTAETKHLEYIYKQKLSELETLKKSLLHQAFIGAL
jgi:type I restriction enzyme S subunit